MEKKIAIITGTSPGIRPEAGFGVYSASKAAVVHLVKAAAIECGPKYNIRYNCVCPGGFVSEMTDMVKNEIIKKVSAGKERPIRRRAEYLLPTRDMGDPATQIVGLVAFLASGEASFIQGAVFSDDAGITL